MTTQPPLPTDRDHDLPPRWDGFPVHWHGWTQSDPVVICPPSAPPTSHHGRADYAGPAEYCYQTSVLTQPMHADNAFISTVISLNREYDRCGTFGGRTPARRYSAKKLAALHDQTLVEYLACFPTVTD